MKRFAASIALCAALFLAATPAPAEPERRQGKVQWVIDGDTFQLESGERVRFIGVNCPEYQPHRKKADPYGREASEFTRKLLDQKTVFLEEDVERVDKYGRTLAYVYLKDGTFVNRMLVERGYAKARYYKPNDRHRDAFRDSEKAAKAAGVGLWSAKKGDE